MEEIARRLLYTTALLLMVATLAANVYANQLSAQANRGWYPPLPIPGR
jgi:hypothetical protein